MVSTSRKKSPNKRILFQIDRKSVYTGRNEKFVEEYVSTTRKTALAGISEKSKQIVPIALIRALTRFNLSTSKDKVCP